MTDQEKAKRDEFWAEIIYELLPFKENGEIDYYGERIILHRYDLPGKIIKRWNWVLRWRLARLQCQYPRHTIWNTYQGYKPDQRDEDAIFNAKVSAAKGQVTKVENRLEKIREHFRSSLFPDAYKTNEIYLKELKKLEEKEQKLNKLLTND